MTSLRLLLGRCLLALHENKGYKQFGCSSSVHYAAQILGIQSREAREYRRVARELQPLAELSVAAEQGTISWSKLREVVRRASPETEGYWLILCRRIQRKADSTFVRRTPWDSLPRDVFEEEEPMTTELRCPMSARVFRMLSQARRLYSIEKEEAVSNAEIVEMVPALCQHLNLGLSRKFHPLCRHPFSVKYRPVFALEWISTQRRLFTSTLKLNIDRALAAYIAGRLADTEVLQKARDEADKDLQAEVARRLPLVNHARELAQELGLLGGASSEPQDAVTSGTSCEVELDASRPRTTGLLAEALGAPIADENADLCPDGQHSDEPERLTWIAADIREPSIRPSDSTLAQ